GSTLQSDADGLNRDLLSLPSSVVDDQGISFASTAAFEWAGRAGSEALARAARDLEFPKALSLSQAYRWRTVLAKARDSNAPLREVQQAQDELSFQITALEQAEEEMEND